MIRFPSICFLCLLLAGLAQPASGETELRFVAFPKLMDAKPVELVIGEGETLPVELSTNSISPAYKVPQLKRWVLGKSSVDDKGKEGFTVYGEAPSIDSPKQLVLVLRKGAEDSDGLELIPLDHRTSNFGGGEYFLMNATKADIAGSIGTGKFSLKPDSHALIAPDPTKEKAGRKYAYARILFRKGEEVQPFFTTLRCWSSFFQ